MQWQPKLKFGTGTTPILKHGHLLQYIPGLKYRPGLPAYIPPKNNTCMNYMMTSGCIKKQNEMEFFKLNVQASPKN